MKNKYWSIVLVLGLACVDLKAQTPKERWVDSVFNRMTVSEKIAQVFMVRLSPYQDDESLDEINAKIEKDGLGGILFTPGNSKKQTTITNRFQSRSKIPLLIGIDGNASQGWEVDSTITLPPSIVQSAMARDSLIFFIGKEIANQMRARGIHINFIDVNSSGSLSYGDDPNLATAKTVLFWNGLRSGHVSACAKYFPAQSVKVLNVHKGFPEIEVSADSIQTHPFRELFNAGVPAMMPASVGLPLFYENKKTAVKNKFSSGVLSAALVGDWAQKNIGFNGLIVVDADAMIASSKKLSSSSVELFAFKTGNDMLITSSNISVTVRRIKRLLRKEKPYAARLDSTIKKILAFKYEAGLSRIQRADVEGVPKKFITPELKTLQQRSYHSAITVVRNTNNTLPVRSLEGCSFFVLHSGDTLKAKTFSKYIQKYAPASVLHANEKTGVPDFSDSTRQQQVIIVALFPATSEAVLLDLLNLIKQPDSTRQVIVSDFGCVAFRKYAHEFPVVVTALDSDRKMLELVPQVIFGGRHAEGVLPVAFGQLAPGTSIHTDHLSRFNFSFPEDASMDSPTLNRIAAIAQEAIDNKATPGCQVLVAKNGKIVYEKSFGHLTYERKMPVDDNTIYDLASVTKVAATLQTVMFMYEKGLIDIYKKASVYLPELRNSNKKDFTLKDILTHQAGLWPFLPFWAQTMKDSLHMPEFYSTSPSSGYPYMVADNLYAATVIRDSLWTWIVNAKIREKPARTPFDYRYSDMGFYILQHLAETILNQPIEDFLAQNLYEPLGAATLGYLPRQRFPISRIAPTENDKLFRKSLLIGTVHDQGAAMHGGIAGHAGLFGTALDLAKLGQMLLQEGSYGGYQYYKPETIRLFTQKQFVKSRRGLGWDKPVIGDWNSPTSLYSSSKTFGHTGFTGTCIWVDPEFDLVYIFLSNRVHPDMTNNKLLSGNIRSRIQDVIYQSIFNYCKTAGSDQQTVEPLPVEASGKSSQ